MAVVCGSGTVAAASCDVQASGVKGLVFLDPKNKVLAEVLRKRFEDPHAKDFEQQIVADFDGACRGVGVSDPVAAVGFCPPRFWGKPSRDT